MLATTPCPTHSCKQNMFLYRKSDNCQYLLLVYLCVGKSIFSEAVNCHEKHKVYSSDAWESEFPKLSRNCHTSVRAETSTCLRRASSIPKG